MIRSFTSSSPAWSASRIARAAPMSYASSVRVFHGISSTVSSQVRIQPTSGEASEVRSSLAASLSAASSTFSGRLAASIRAR